MMKKLIGITMLMTVFLMTATAFAEERQPYGVYVGAKIGMSIENLTDRKISGNGWYEDDQNYGPAYRWGMGNKSDAVLSGGVALGYDLAPRLDIPVRVELDYTARGDAKGSSKKQTNYEYVDEGTTVSNVSGKQKNTVGLQTVMLNAWFDIPTGTAFTPYLGGGVGFGFIRHKTNITVSDPLETDSLGRSKNTTNFAWSLGGGLAYDVTDNWALDLGYRYINAGSADITVKDADGDSFAKSKLHVDSHDVLLGLRYTF